MNQAEALSWLICSLLLAVPVLVAGEAILLRAACHFCRVAVPRFGKAMGIVLAAGFVTALAGVVPLFCLTLLSARGPQGEDDGARAVWMVRMLVFPFLIAVSAAVYAHFLKVTFGKALLVRLAQLGITTILSLLVTGVAILGLWIKDTRQVPSAAEIKKSADEAAARARTAAEKLHTDAISRTQDGEQLAGAGKTQEAEEALREAASHWQQLAGAGADPKYRLEQARVQLSLADLLFRAARAKDAEEAWQEAVVLWKNLADELPAEAEYARGLGKSQLGLGEMLLRAGRAPEAVPPGRDAMRIFEKLTAEFPAELEYRRQLARSHRVLGEALAAIGREQEAQAELNQALNLSKRLAAEFTAEADPRLEQTRSLEVLGYLFLKTGRKADAEAAYREALPLAQALLAGSTENAEYRRALARIQKGLGMVLYATGRAWEAEPADRAAIALWQQLASGASLWPEEENDVAGAMVNLAAVLRDRKEPAGARDLLVQAAPHHQAALKAVPANPRYRLYFRSNRAMLCEVLISLADHAAAAGAAQELRRAGVDPGPDSYDTARCLARCAALAGKPQWLLGPRSDEPMRTYAVQAVEALREAVQKGYRQPARKAPEHDFDGLRALVRNHLERAETLRRSGTALYALMAYGDANEIWALLAAVFPAVPEYRQEMAAIVLQHCALASEYSWAAEGSYKNALVLFQGLAEAFPDRPDYRQETARCHYQLAGLSRRKGEIPEAEAAYRAALTIQAKLVAGFPAHADYRLDFARSHSALGLLLAQTDRQPEGEAELRQAEHIYREGAASLQDKPPQRRELTNYHEDLGLLLSRTGRAREAAVELRQALSVRKLLPRASPGKPDPRGELAGTYARLGEALQHTQPAEAESAFRNALALWQDLAGNANAMPEDRRRLARGYSQLGAFFMQAGRFAEAEAAYRDALALDQKLPDVYAYRNEMAVTMCDLALVLRANKQLQGARALLEKALPYHQVAVTAQPFDRIYHGDRRKTQRALAETLLLLADYAEAAKAAAHLVHDPYASSREHYQIACLIGRCMALAGKDSKLPQAKRAEVVSLYGYDALWALRDAIREGYRDVAQLERDPDLDPLRARDDFKSLVAELKKKQ
jgi:tetratricopeptide (TPR) repeat protein